MDQISKKRKNKQEGNGPAAAADTPKLTSEEATRIIDSLSPESIRQIVASAMCGEADVLTSVRQIIDQDQGQRKLFIRGLGWDTTSDVLTSYFSQYGDLQEAVVINDKTTGKSKGYGFIVFSHVDGAIVALREPSKKIDGRVAVVQLAAVGATNSAAPASAVDPGHRKIYIGNVPAEMNADRLLSHFSTYGEIEEGPLGFDKITGKSKGYAMFVYKTVDGARTALVDPMKFIDGVHLLCKYADNKKTKTDAVPATVLQHHVLPSGGLSSVPGESLPVGPFSSHYAIPPGAVSAYGAYPASAAYPGSAAVPVTPAAGLSHQHPLSSAGAAYATAAAGGAHAPSSASAHVTPGGYYGGGSYAPSATYGSVPAASGYGGLGLGSTLYRTSAAYVEPGAHYGGLSSSAYPSHRAASPPTLPRAPAATYAAIPPYY